MIVRFLLGLGDPVLKTIQLSDRPFYLAQQRHDRFLIFKFFIDLKDHRIDTDNGC